MADSDDDLLYDGIPISSYRVVDLRAILDRLSLSKAGTKKELSARLSSYVMSLDDYKRPSGAESIGIEDSEEQPASQGSRSEGPTPASERRRSRRGDSGVEEAMEVDSPRRRSSRRRGGDDDEEECVEKADIPVVPKLSLKGRLASASVIEPEAQVSTATESDEDEDEDSSSSSNKRKHKHKKRRDKDVEGDREVTKEEKRERKEKRREEKERRKRERDSSGHSSGREDSKPDDGNKQTPEEEEPTETLIEPPVVKQTYPVLGKTAEERGNTPSKARTDQIAAETEASPKKPGQNPSLEKVAEDSVTKTPVEPASPKIIPEPDSRKNPVESASPKKPVEPVSSKKPVEPVSSKKPVEPVSSKKPVDPASPKKPVESGTPQNPVESVPAEKSVESASPKKTVERPELKKPHVEQASAEKPRAHDEPASPKKPHVEHMKKPEPAPAEKPRGERASGERVHDHESTRKPREHASRDRSREHVSRDSSREHTSRDSSREHTSRDRPRDHASRDRAHEHSSRDRPHEHTSPKKPHEQSSEKEPSKSTAPIPPVEIEARKKHVEQDVEKKPSRGAEDEKKVASAESPGKTLTAVVKDAREDSKPGIPSSGKTSVHDGDISARKSTREVKVAVAAEVVPEVKTDSGLAKPLGEKDVGSVKPPDAKDVAEKDVSAAKPLGDNKQAPVDPKSNQGKPEPGVLKKMDVDEGGDRGSVEGTAERRYTTKEGASIVVKMPEKRHEESRKIKLKRSSESRSSVKDRTESTSENSKDHKTTESAGKTDSRERPAASAAEKKDERVEKKDDRRDKKEERRGMRDERHEKTDERSEKKDERHEKDSKSPRRHEEDVHHRTERRKLEIKRPQSPIHRPKQPRHRISPPKEERPRINSSKEERARISPSKEEHAPVNVPKEEQAPVSLAKGTVEPSVSVKESDDLAMEKKEVHDEKPVLDPSKPKPGRRKLQMKRKGPAVDEESKDVGAGSENTEDHGKKRRGWGSSGITSRKGTFEISMETLRSLVSPEPEKKEHEEPIAEETMHHEEEEGGEAVSPRKRRAASEDNHDEGEIANGEGIEGEVPIPRKVRKRSVSLKTADDEEMKEDGEENNENVAPREVKRKFSFEDGEREVSRRVTVKNDVQSTGIAPRGVGGVTPPPSPPSRVIRIWNLVRPYTVNQLKDLLCRTGSLEPGLFWTDKIKSQCIACFETEEQAIETRVSLHGAKWPLSNPKSLRVDFSTESELQDYLTKDQEESNAAAARAQRSAERDVGKEPEIGKEKEGRIAERDRKRSPLRFDGAERSRRSRSVEDGRSRRIDERGRRGSRSPDQSLREWDRVKVGERSPGAREREREIRRRERIREEETARARGDRRDRELAKSPAKLLDDLFRKTKATPCIYWLPLTEEQIVQKEEERRQRVLERQRRIAEMEKLDKERRRVSRSPSRSPRGRFRGGGRGRRFP